MDNIKLTYRKRVYSPPPFVQFLSQMIIYPCILLIQQKDNFRSFVQFLYIYIPKTLNIPDANLANNAELERHLFARRFTLSHLVVGPCGQG